MKTQLILGVAALVLAGCGSERKDAPENISTDAAAANQSAAAEGPSPTGGGGSSSSGGGGGDLIQPGEWETKVEVVEVDAPGMPQQVKDMMAKAMAGSQTSIRDCVTPEEARRPKPDLFAGKNEGNCTSSDFSMSGGRLRGTISCPAPQGQAGSVTMVMDGQFGPQSYTGTNSMTTDAAGSKMTVKARVTGRRVGECSAAAREG